MQFHETHSAENADNQFNQYDRLREEEASDIQRHEIEPSEHEESIIVDTIARVRDIAQAYRTNEWRLPRNIIHLLTPGAVSQITRGEIAIGFYNRLTETIAVERSESGLRFATSLAHELFHHIGQARYGGAASYTRLLKRTSSFPDRSEFSLKDVIEALISELEYEFYLSASSGSIYEEEIETTRNAKAQLGELLREFNTSRSTQKMDLLSTMADVYAIPKSEAEEIDRVVKSKANPEYKMGWIVGGLGRLEETNQLAQRGRRIERQKLGRILTLHADDPREFSTLLVTTYLRGEHEHLLRIIEDALRPISLR